MEKIVVLDCSEYYAQWSEARSHVQNAIRCLEVAAQLPGVGADEIGESTAAIEGLKRGWFYQSGFTESELWAEVKDTFE